MTLAYTNPVWSGYLADPFVLRWRGDYYAYGTGGPHDPPHRPGPVFPVLRSHDFARWEPLGGALVPLADDHATSYWAPEVAERDGRFYMYYSAGGDEGEHHRLRVAMADHPAGPFLDAGRLLLPDEPFSIDGHPFRDPADGRWYLFFAKDFFDGRVGTGVAVVPLADDMMTPAAEPLPVLRASADWQTYEQHRHWYGRIWERWHTVEGPFVVAREGRYYCFYSGGLWKGESYGVGVARADHPLGPYREFGDGSGPAVLHATEGPLRGPGHCSVVVGPDDRTDYMVYHAWDPGWTARRMCLDRLEWREEGPRCAGPTWTPQQLQAP